MIEGRRVFGVITARGGSKGLPRKNVLPLGGKALVGWSVAAAAGSKLLDRTVVSTDDEEIAEAARQAGGDVPFLRPAEFATDASPIVDAVLHAVDTLKDDCHYVVLLQATSPFRTSADIDGVIETCARLDAPACVSVTPLTKTPAWMFTIDADRRLRPLLAGAQVAGRRQEQAPAFIPNGAVYVAALDWLRRTQSFYGERVAAYEMPAERSVDIDTWIEFKLAEAMLR